MEIAQLVVSNQMILFYTFIQSHIDIFNLFFADLIALIIVGS